MKSENYILDLDNTLYDYKVPHNIAIKRVLSNFSDEFGIGIDKSEKIFRAARKKTQEQLVNTAASHNRLLYFQKMLELNNINSLDYAMKYYDIYWDTFLENMKLFEDARLFLEKIKTSGCGVCILTDLTAHIQYRKIQKLGLSRFVDFMVTSEEVGVEKPNPKMFKIALYKLNCDPKQTIMIGDNWEKDIIGASAVGLKAIWMNHDKDSRELPDGVIEVENFEEINQL